MVCFCLPCDDGVRFPDRAALVGGSIQAFFRDFRPKLLYRPRCRFVRMPFGVIRGPRRFSQAPTIGCISEGTSCAHTTGSGSTGFSRRLFPVVLLVALGQRSAAGNCCRRDCRRRRLVVSAATWRALAGFVIYSGMLLAAAAVNPKGLSWRVCCPATERFATKPLFS